MLQTRRETMPIQIRVSHHDRLVVVVVHGTITAEEIQNAIREHWDTGLIHYRKLIDVAAGRSDTDIAQIKAMVTLIRGAPDAGKRGPVAFVVDGNRGETVRELATFTEEGERPLRVFTSLREARGWLDEIYKIELKR
jgi:hypothetical protein